MWLRFAHILTLPCLAALAPAQVKAEEPQPASAEQIAASLRFEAFHATAARTFAKLGRRALPVLEQGLRDGTATEAHGALHCLVALRGLDGEVIRLVEWALVHRAEILGEPRRSGPLFGFLLARVAADPRAVDALWRMLDGRWQDQAIRALGAYRPTPEVLLGHLARDLDSGDPQRIRRASWYFAHRPYGFQPATEAISMAVERALAKSPPDFTELQRLADAKRGLDTRLAQSFLALYKDVQQARQARQARRERERDLSAAIKAHRYLQLARIPAMLDDAAQALAALGKPVLPILQRACGDDAAPVARCAARALVALPLPAAELAQHVHALARDRQRPAAARVEAIDYLGRQSERQDAEGRLTTLLALLDDAEPTSVRVAAIRALGHTERRRHDVTNALERCLRDPSVEVARYATSTLGTMCRDSDPRTMMLLVRQLQSPHEVIQRTAVQSLAGKGAEVHLRRLRDRPGLATSVRDAIDRALLVRNRELAGFLIADYSDNHILQVDLQGQTLRKIEGVFGAWDAAMLDNGNILITCFSVGRIYEVTPEGKTVWNFEDVKNPYDADRLPNGNTLIADTFGGRVIEVDKAGKIVWSYSRNIRPYDADRLPNGNTLIADTRGDRVIEVDCDGGIVWSLDNVPNVHDADRLPNGNTLVTIRMLNEVREVDRNGAVVARIRDLSSPSDADRLPDGRTLVAENGWVRIFDANGSESWRKAVTWAVEANPVWKHQLAAAPEAAPRKDR